MKIAKDSKCYIYLRDWDICIEHRFILKKKLFGNSCTKFNTYCTILGVTCTKLYNMRRKNCQKLKIEFYGHIRGPE